MSFIGAQLITNFASGIKQNTIMETVQKKFLTVGETQAYLGSSRRFIYNLVDRGDLDIKKVGRRSYFETQQIEALFKSKK